LFSVASTVEVGHRLDSLVWPEASRFPVNRGSAKVRSLVWADLVESDDPLIVAGYASIAQLIDFVAVWGDRHMGEGRARILLGAEPFPTARRSFGSSTAGFTEEVERYWLEERGVSLRQSARIIQAIEAVDAGRVEARFLHGTSVLHAKMFVGTKAATVGSSNFTAAGLSTQVEVNVRFELSSEPERYRDAAAIGQNLWEAAAEWTPHFRALLCEMLQVVGWREALARACAELLEGYWAERYMSAPSAETAALWPAQRAGIAQALWVSKEVGSVLVADATGSGKTKMGAHLVRAVRDRLWSTGRVRRDLCVVITPPAIADTWEREALRCGLSLTIASHGMLSRAAADGPRTEEQAVAEAQILAVDEAHNFLNRDAKRTRQVHRSRADHVLLFTATPINRGAADLLSLVNLLGADNFDDSTLEVLSKLSRRRGVERVFTVEEHNSVRAEIARFTVRRTKTVLNELVDRSPDAYRHPDTDRVCRYPVHDARTYDTGETDGDAQIASLIRKRVASLSGVARLERTIAIPVFLRSQYSDERWLLFRLRSTRGLAAHQVLGALRSSRAALVEHLSGTTASVARFGLDPAFKAASTGDVIGSLEDLARQGPPKVELDCDLPGWLTDPRVWAEACQAEAVRYRDVLEQTEALSPAREQMKANLIASVAIERQRVLAFDHHPVTLAALSAHLFDLGIEPVVAIGGDPPSRRKVERLFRREATETAVALCSDALNEGLNLQGAAALVHLDLPTTLRVAEQRVGRVDRMDSPHDSIQVWWPRDGEAFATRANELLTQRSEENARLLGSNLPIPDLGPTSRDEKIIRVEERIAEAEAPGAEQWDGIRDALDPVRSLVSGHNPVLAQPLYDQLRQVRHRVLSRVSAVRSDRPWAFFATGGSSDGAPRWLFLDGPNLHPVANLEGACAHLRRELEQDPPAAGFDEDAIRLLDQALDVAARREFDELPRRMRRALDQMLRVLPTWTEAARRASDEEGAQAIRNHVDLARPRGPETPVDPYLVAERWLSLVAPTLDRYRQEHRNRPYVLISDITPTLITEPQSSATVVAAFADLPDLIPLDQRVTACILGLADTHEPPPRASVADGHRGSL
jgi:superfamily II DNA or RNA helicase